MNLLNCSYTEKLIRSRIIKEYLLAINTDKTVCFSCGNASNNLKRVGLDVTEVLNPLKWWDPFEIACKYQIFDSTSGHLPMFLMERIARALLLKYSDVFVEEKETYFIETGSGETFVCLKMAFPTMRMVPVYNNAKPATTFNEEAPLNNLVKALCYKKRIILCPV